MQCHFLHISNGKCGLEGMRVFCFRASLTSVQKCSVRSLVFDCENPLHGLTHSLEEEKKNTSEKNNSLHVLQKACRYGFHQNFRILKTLKFVGIILFLFRYISFFFFFTLLKDKHKRPLLYRHTCCKGTKKKKKEYSLEQIKDRRCEVGLGVPLD